MLIFQELLTSALHGGDMKTRDSRPMSRFISETIQDMVIVTIECE